VIAELLLVAWPVVQSSNLADAIGFVVFAGSRKGREPEGEAWLLEGWTRKAISLNKR
jgi:hypothetical protein